jgi:integrase
MAAFNAHRMQQARERLAAGDSWHDGALIFVSSIGTPMEPQNVNRRFDELRAKADLDWLRLLDLRHACATYLLANGVEPRTVMEILGHSTIHLTMDLYGHVLPDRQRAAAYAMDRAMDTR